MNVTEFLTVAAGTARALDDWHERMGPHGSLCPEVFSNGAGGWVLAGHSRAGTQIEVAPPYAAPELTQWLVRGADERSDLYALGVILYELLTAQLPFPATSAAAWTQCHLAEQPTMPSKLVADVPAVLERIVLRLLAKAPEQRYQTARGLAADIERCQQELADTGRLAPFALGGGDLPDLLVVSGRLYGREPRLARLRSAYNRVAGGGRAKLACVTGESGVGKSALLAAFGSETAAAGGRVVVEKFDQYQRSVPFATVARLLARLGAQLLDDPPELVARWRSELPIELGSCADALVDLVPLLARLLGEQPPVPELPREARHRMHLAVCRFLAVVTRTDRPVVIALDDLHHADVASLELLGQVLADPGIGNLLVVVSYEPKTAGVDHPLTAMLQGLDRMATAVPLRPLPDSGLAGLLADTLHLSRGQVLPLAGVVAEKTRSNPLLLGQFLHHLREQELIGFNPKSPFWTWDLDAIRKTSLGNNRIELISSRLQTLTPQLRGLLEVAALLGDQFDGQALATVTGEPVTELVARLRPAIARQMVLVVGAGTYRWAHDQIRTAAVALIPTRQVAERRLTIGRAMHAALSKQERVERTYELVEHFNAAASLITRHEEQALVAELNLTAGRRAKRSGAPAAAHGYFTAGLAALPPDAWSRWYELACALHTEAAQAMRQAGEPDKAQELLDLSMAHTRVELGQVELLRLNANLPRLGGGWDADEEPGVRGLRLLGIDLPEDPAGWPAAADAMMATLGHRLAGLRVEDLSGRPVMTDSRALAAANLIAALLPSAQIRSADWFALLSAVGVGLALDHGCAAASSITFAFYGLTLADRGHDEAAVLCLEAGLRLLESVPAAEFAARTKPVVALTTPPWFRSAESALRLFQEAYRDAGEHGDIQYMKANWVLYHMHMFVMGTRLDLVAEEIDAVWGLLERYGDDGLICMGNRLMDDIVSRLRGTSSQRGGPEKPAEVTFAELSRQGKLGYASILNLTRMLSASYLLGDYPEALDLAQTVETIEPEGRGRLTVTERSFYHALTLTALYDSATPDTQRAWSAKLDELQAGLDEWATLGPATFGYRALLVSAERARIAGQVDQALARYTRAVCAARMHGFVHGEAIAAELGGRYALARFETDTAAAYLDRARSCYRQWGAATKVSQIDQLLAAVPLRERPAAPVDQLDLLTAVKAFQAGIARENAILRARLTGANQILDAIFDRLPVGLILLNPDLTVRRASPRAIELIGLPIQPGTPHADLFDRLTLVDPQSPPQSPPYWFEPVASGDQEPIHREVVVVHQAVRRRLNTSAIALRDEDGSLLGVTVLVAEAG